MDMQQVIAAAGNLATLCRAVGRQHSTVLKWRRVPVHHLEAVSKLTKISRRDLRPDLWEAMRTGKK